MQITKCEFAVSVCILEDTNTRAPGIKGYFPQLLEYQDFCSMLKELYCVFEGPLGILKFEL